MKFGTSIVVVGLGAFVAVVGAALARDPAFQAHMWIMFFVLAGAGNRAVCAAPASARPRPRRRRRFRCMPTPAGYMDETDPLRRHRDVVWGIVGMLVGLIIALQLAYPDLNVEPWFNFGRMRPLHTSAVIFAFGGNALIATSLLRRAAHLARAAVRRQSRLVRVLGLPAVHRPGRHRLPARHHPEPRIRRARMVCRHLADHRLGRLSRGVPRHHRQAQGTAHLRRQLVLPVLHRDHRDAARGQQPGGAGLLPRLEELLGCSPACRTR